MKNKTLLGKAKKTVVLAILAAMMAVSPAASVNVAAEVIEKDGYSIVTGEDIPAYVQEKQGTDVKVSRYDLGGGWTQYCGYSSTGEWFTYMYQMVDEKEVLAHNVIRYSEQIKNLYENGVSVDHTKLAENELTDFSAVPADVLKAAGEETLTRVICRKAISDTKVQYYGTDADGKSFDFTYTVNADGTEVFAANNGWNEENGKKYWYENGVKQGLEGRGKEIYDPESDAWYWLDSVQGGAMAVSKDVYQESWAGQWGDYVGDDAGNLYGKWVRYDENGHMVKGWDTNEDGTYYFDLQTGAMVKGLCEIDGKKYAFDKTTGIMVKDGLFAADDGFTYGFDADGNMVKGEAIIDGKICYFNLETGHGLHQRFIDFSERTTLENVYWYENGVRQGTEGRGKEIYDPESNAWYWLDAAQNGAVARSKDVYQETEDGAGKWVRYSGSVMVKGWDAEKDEDGNEHYYYFDLITGAMAKGVVEIDGYSYTFDDMTGILKNASSDDIARIEKKLGTNQSGVRGSHIATPLSKW